jgi:hypothetical protein
MSINSIYSYDKKFIHLISTVYLKYSDTSDIKLLVANLYQFGLIDLEVEIFWSKVMDVLRVNIFCLKNYLQGYDNMDNMLGIFEKNYIDKLNKIVL